ncbi:MBL fold metallo-hydrolase [Caldicoprobacter faecalis]|uniref:Ribonuclease BN, tRNA processing enzyme n=1 Tax=Caldicoprobacter faecalis TaxID=937334 RepID=A0A1I5Y5L6_9FIRM|nr:MBL fold metallo-hydrolase [Caldicoprobacter faecalis]SFQ39454.1 Ribonuclease BN, tRNA processing enzyme [Caldicoprobacter faecalis]
MKVTVLGKYGPFPAASGACSGYLVQEGSTRILVECGNGVLSRLQQICPIDELKAIVISHLHSDHVSDMLVLRYALDILNVRGLREVKPLPVYVPETPKDEYDRLFFKNVFEVHPIHDGMQLQIGELSFYFQEMTHPVQSFGIKIAGGNKTLVYTGDTNYNEKIEAFACGADLFIADAGLLEKDKTSPNVPHLTAREVGLIAAKAKVKQLMLTHIWPWYDEKDILAEAAASYPRAFIAQEMKEYSV